MGSGYISPGGRGCPGAPTTRVPRVGHILGGSWVPGVGEKQCDFPHSLPPLCPQGLRAIRPSHTCTPTLLQLVVAEADQKRLIELQFARSLPHHHRVSHAGLVGGGNAEELHVMQVWGEGSCRLLL